MAVHPNATTPKGNGFGLQPEALLKRRFARQQDLSSSAHNAMPREAFGAIQGPDYLPRRAGKSGRPRYIAVRGDFPFRDSADGVADGVKHISTAPDTMPGSAAILAPE